LVVGHFHADHWIDIAPLRYRFPWGEAAPRPLPVYLPPGGREKLDHLALVMSERPGFFEVAFEVHEYATGDSIGIGDLIVRPRPIGHYVPAWSMSIEAPGGERVVYAGDMGPSNDLIEFARGAQLLILEATLETSQFDDQKRGHLTTEEAVEHVVRSGVPRGLLVHYPIEQRDRVLAVCADSDGIVVPALPDTTIDVAAGEAPVVTLPAGDVPAMRA
jgi:ribonuclease BN (tRNA processing enzyme)